MTKIMAITMIPVLALATFIAGQNQGLSQDAKSVAIDATEYATTFQSVRDEQRRRDALIQRASHELERAKLQEQKRRAKAKARAEARAEREAQARREAQAEAATRAVTREPVTSSGSLPELLLIIRSHESGGNYSAYNGSGCEGYGCYGAYQMHGLYADDWARRYGASEWAGTSPNQWPAAVQDKVALGLFYSTSPNGQHWCNWTDYC